MINILEHISASKIAFQGRFGAYSDMACRSVFPTLETVPCLDFEATFAAVRDGEADLAMIPVENSTAGRVSDIHALLPGSGLFAVGEHYQLIEHNLLAIPGACLEDMRFVHSHVQALHQCRELIQSLRLTPTICLDTAGSAALLSDSRDKQTCVIASLLAGEIYGLVPLKTHVEDVAGNTTRFLVMSRQHYVPVYDDRLVVTSLFFEVRDIPAALFKALSSFATNNINITRLESYLDQSFQAARFFIDFEGHPEDYHVRLALEELAFFSTGITMVGTYKASKWRLSQRIDLKESGS